VASVFRYLEKHCTFAKIHGACSVAETDIRFRSQTRDRLVRESQFAASGHSGLDGITTANAFTDCDSAWLSLGRTKLYVFDRLCDARFFQLCGV
jgi:hypothetical protein